MLKGLLISALCVALLMPNFVFARSSSDTHWSFNLQTRHRASFTEARDKDDATSAYSKCEGTSDGSSVWNWIVKDDYTDVGCSPHMVIPGREVFMTNNAYETYNHCMVRLGVSAEKDKKINAWGVWSPDSV